MTPHPRHPYIEVVHSVADRLRRGAVWYLEGRLSTVWVGIVPDTMVGSVGHMGYKRRGRLEYIERFLVPRPVRTVWAPESTPSGARVELSTTKTFGQPTVLYRCMVLSIHGRYDAVFLLVRAKEAGVQRSMGEDQCTTLIDRYCSQLVDRSPYSATMVARVPTMLTRHSDTPVPRTETRAAHRVLYVVVTEYPHNAATVWGRAM